MKSHNRLSWEVFAGKCVDLRCALLVTLMACCFSKATLAGAQLNTTGLESTQKVTELAGVSVFKGIKYADAPVEDKRWKVTNIYPLVWPIRQSVNDRIPACVQSPIKNEDHFFYSYPPAFTDEDCLYLNVWAPTISVEKEDKKPVMVWIHGGSLLEGTSLIPIYNGAELAKKGVVVVTINYRLNILGYFSHPEISSSSPEGSGANFGLHDQIQALRWVQTYIEKFGGDKGNVTIFGESAGAYSVVQLLVSPLSKGLFHKAIAQSPYIKPLHHLTEPQFGRPSAENAGLKFAASVGVENLAELRSLPVEKLIKTVEAMDDVYVRIPSPVVDQHLLTDQIFTTIERGKQHNVPVLMGFNSHEGFHMSFYPQWKKSLPTSAEDYIDKVKKRYGDLADEYLKIYPPEDLHQAIFAPYRDGFFGWAAQKYIRSAAINNTSGAYLYYYDHDWAGDTSLSAFHASELPFVFNNVKHGAKYSSNWPDLKPTQADLNLANTMSDYWVAFAKHGKPSVKGLPEWKPYLNHSKNYMHFHNGKATPDKNLLPGSYELHDKIIANRIERGDQPWGLSNIGLLAPVLPEYRSSIREGKVSQ